MATTNGDVGSPVAPRLRLDDLRDNHADVGGRQCLRADRVRNCLDH